MKDDSHFQYSININGQVQKRFIANIINISDSKFCREFAEKFILTVRQSERDNYLS